MRLSRRIAWALGLLTIIVGGMLIREGQVTLGGFAVVAAIMLIGLAVVAPRASGVRLRIVRSFPLHGVLMVAGAAVAISQGDNRSAGEFAGIALLSLLGWVVAQRRTRSRQRAIAYLSYFKD